MIGETGESGVILNRQPIFVSILHRDSTALEILLEHSSSEALHDIEDSRTSTGLSPMGLACVLEKWPMVSILCARFPGLVNLEDHENLTPF